MIMSIAKSSCVGRRGSERAVGSIGIGNSARAIVRILVSDDFEMRRSSRRTRIISFQSPLCGQRLI